MGKKVTYAIGYSRQSPFAQELKEQKSRYETELELGHEFKAATIALEISDLLIAQVDEIDPDLPSHVQEQDTRNYLVKAIYYSKKAIGMFQKKKNEYNLVNAYYNLSQCHLSLQDFELAVRYGSIAVSYMPSNNYDKHKLQMIYKTIADAYFIKGLDTHSTHQDFSKAFEYYMKEKCVLDTMRLDDVDRDPTVLPQLIRSSHFNLGLVCSRIMSHSHLAEGYLKLAIDQAQELRDYANEKRTWWELGNHYRRSGQDSFVKGCQVKEMNIIRHHGFKDDEPPCLEERIKLHLEFEEFSECYRLAKRYKELLVQKYQEYYEAIYDLIQESEQLTKQYKQKGPSNTLTVSIEKAALLHELTVIQMDHQMFRAALKSADRGLQDIHHCKKSSATLYMGLLELKAEAQWQLREFTIETYVNTSNQLLEIIQTHTKNPRLQAEQKMAVYKQRVEIHMYYNQEARANHFKALWHEAKTQFESVSRNEKVSESFDFGSRITPSHRMLLQSDVFTIQVKVLLLEPVIVHIVCYDMALSIHWLMEEVKTKTWQTHGYEPMINHMRTQGSDILSTDSLQDVIFEQNQVVDAIVTGTVLKSALEIYLNGCERLDVRISSTIRNVLSNVEHGKIPLKGLLSKEQIPVIKQVLERMNLINELDLSYNFLSDEEIDLLLTHAKIPNEINLSNNEITITTVKRMLVTFSNSDLARITLSFNPIGPQLIEQVPRMISAFPNLRMLNLESTCLGELIQVDQETKELYKKISLLDIPYLITINLSDNHFQNDMLSVWTCLLASIGRLDKLHLTGISSDMEWDNFMSFSETSLRGIDYSYSPDKILNIQDIQQLLVSGQRLAELDLSGCGLTAQEMTRLCQGNEYHTNLKYVSFQYNPLIGDQGLETFYKAFKHCRIKKLNFSYCGLTFESAHRIAQWITDGNIEEMDITGNDIFQTEYQLDQFLVMYTEGDTKIIFDFAQLAENKIIPRTMQRQPKQPMTPF